MLFGPRCWTFHSRPPYLTSSGSLSFSGAPSSAQGEWWSRRLEETAVHGNIKAPSPVEPPCWTKNYTVHFWAPTFKWGISIANIADFSKPPEKISYPQQVAVACTGLIWSRYSTVITPKNWNLFSVNVAMAGTGLYQLTRKVRQDYFSEKEEAQIEA